MVFSLIFGYLAIPDICLVSNLIKGIYKYSFHLLPWNIVYGSLLDFRFLQHITFKEACWEFCHLTPSFPFSPLLHKMVACQRWKTLPLSHPPLSHTYKYKRGFPTYFICTDEDYINMLDFIDADVVVTCMWHFIRKCIKKPFYRKVLQRIIFALINLWFFNFIIDLFVPINTILPFIMYHIIYTDTLNC